MLGIRVCIFSEAGKVLKPLGIDAWEEKTLSCMAEEIMSIANRPLVLIDGKGGAGKTSLAVKLAKLLNANVIGTDDACWHADPIHWDGEMLDGILLPWLAGKNVAYTPSGWVKKNRPGSIVVDSSKPLIIEGNGACRKTLRKFSTYSVWVETEPTLARMRVIERDFAAGENGGTIESVTSFTDWWDSVIDPFLAEEESWKYANIIVSGTLSDLDSNTLQVYISGQTKI